MAAPAGAQPQSSDEPSPAESAAGALSPASLARIRAAIEANRRAEQSRRTVFDSPEDGWIVPPRPPVELAPGLGFLEGLGLYRDLTRGREPAPIGGPGHWAMMHQMTPREVTEVLQSDGLAIGTVSAFAVGAAGLPYAVRKIAGWFSRFGSGSRAAPPARPVLTSTQEAAVLEDMRANTGVIDATLSQRGRTVALSLLVPAGTGPRVAREIGERFVRLVGRRAAAEPSRGADVPGEDTADEDAPGIAGGGAGGASAQGEDAAVEANEIGPGTFDYVISVRSPDAVIARGGKATDEPLVRW